MERELTVADWRGYAQGQFPESAWSVDGDVLRAVAAGPRIDLISRERFRDLVLGFDLASDEVRERIARSRFRDFPQFGRLREGHIVLLHRGTEAWFRRLRIEVLQGS